MLGLWSLTILLVSNVVAREDSIQLRQDRRQFVRTEKYTNSSSSSTIGDTTSINGITTTTISFPFKPHITSSSLSTSTSEVWSSNVSTPSSQSPTTIPIQSSTSARSSDNLSTVSFYTLTDLLPTTLNASTVSVACDGTATYTNSVPPTVFLTITEGYEVTLTASNATMTAPPLLITPASACSQIILSKAMPPLIAPSIVATMCGDGVCPQAPQSEASGTGAFTATPAALTSTVLVTKKTPVPVVPRSKTPPPMFHFPSSTHSSVAWPSSSPGGNPPVPPPSSKSQPQETFGSSHLNGAKSSNPVNWLSISSAPEKSAGTTKGGGDTENKVPTPTSPNVKSTLLTKGPGSTFKSLDNGHPVSSQTTVRPAISAILSASSVVIGGMTFPIPAQPAGTTLLVNGQTFTIKPDVVIGPTTTIRISLAGKEQALTTSPPSMLITTVGSLTFSVGSTQAVISGTTYKIGPGVKPTTAVVHGQTISIGPSGIGFAWTTVPPARTIATPYSVITAGDLTLSVKSGTAVISGTTYKIGPGSTPRTVVIGGQPISIGPGGVGLATTTINQATTTTTITTVPSSTGVSIATHTGGAVTSSHCEGLLGVVVLAGVAAFAF